ncbi:MAG: winged helix-turn-helix transcriptional regulator, partial [Candidatus Hadarchaeales archaeon]
MNEKEKKILLSLLEDASLPVIEVARRAGTTRQTVAKKIEELKKTVVRKITAELN